MYYLGVDTVKIFDDIKTGLNQAVEFERKNHDNKTNTLVVEKCEDIEVDNNHDVPCYTKGK